MIRYYISDQMRGKPEDNFPQFYAIEGALRLWFDSEIANGGWKLLEEEGYEILNPARNFGGDRTRDREEYMKLDIQHVLDADCVVLGPDWTNSPGAKLEADVAVQTGKVFLLAQPTFEGEFVFESVDPKWVEGARRLADSPVAEQVRSLPERIKSLLDPAPRPVESTEQVRTFQTGADRDGNVDRKHDYEGFLSPYAIRAFGAYMHKHRTRRDGTLRDADNWQHGIPSHVYMQSAWRHFMDWWCLHRGMDVDDFDGNEVDLESALCGLLFNVQGYLHEHMKGN